MLSPRATKMYAVADRVCLTSQLTMVQLMEKHLPELDPEVAEIMVSKHVEDEVQP